LRDDSESLGQQRWSHVFVACSLVRGTSPAQTDQLQANTLGVRKIRRGRILVNASRMLYATRLLVSEVLEVRRDTEVATAQELDDSLQFVFLFSRDADLPVLQLTLHFEPL
jgi:hypothetical protein